MESKSKRYTLVTITSIAFKLTRRTYDCRSVNNIMHRLRFLLTQTSDISLTEENADILFGPLCTWIASPWLEKMKIPTAETAITDATVLAGAPHEANDIHHPLFPKFIIALRMSIFWTLFKKHAHLFPPEALFGYYIGIAIDIHIPAFLLPQPTIFAVYSAKYGTTPETVKISDVLNDDDDDIPISLNMLEDLWSDHINSNRTRATPTATQLSSIKQKSLYLKSAHKEQQQLQLLLLKCMINTLSTRYIIKSVEDGLLCETPNKLIARIVKSFLVGAYQHARASIAPPRVRVLVYNATPKELASIVTRFKPKEAYSVVTEFVAALTAHHETLTHILNEDPIFQAYKHKATTIADSVLRPIIIASLLASGSISALVASVDASHVNAEPRKGKKSNLSVGRIFINVTTRSAESPKLIPRPPLQRLFWELARILDIKHDVDKQQLHLATQNIHMDTLYTVLRSQPQTLRIYKAILTRINVSMDGISTIAKGFINIDPQRIAKHLSACVDTLSLTDRAKLYIYTHYISTRSKISCQKIHTKRVIQPISPDRPLPFVIVCNRCCSIRTHCSDLIYARKKSKRKHVATSIDIHTSQIVCGACRSDDVGVVDARSVRHLKSQPFFFLTLAFCPLMQAFHFQPVVQAATETVPLHHFLAPLPCTQGFWLTLFD